MNERLIDEAISLLHSQHHEDLALEIESLRSELARVKRIAGDRLDKISRLQTELSNHIGIESENDDSDDHGGLWGAHCRGEI